MQITKLEYCSKDIYKTHIDGVVLKLDSATVLKKNLKSGKEISPKEFEALSQISEYICAKTYAANSLARSASSEKEMDLKLMRRGYSKKVRGEVLKFLKSKKFVNDEEFAKNYVRYACETKKFGKMRIKCELAKKGVSSEISAKVLEGLDDGENLKIAAEKELCKETGRDRKTIEKIKRRLFARGYSVYAINEFFADLDETEE